MKFLPLFAFWLLWFLNFFSRASFSPLLPLIEDSLSLTHGEAGGLATSYCMGYGIMLLIAGRYASGWGYKRTVAFGFAGTGLSLIALQWLTSYPAFHLLFLFLGLTAGTYLPSILPIITETYESKHWGKAFGFHDSAASVALLSAPIIFAFGLQLLHWKQILLLLGLASILTPLFFWKVSKEPPHPALHASPRYLDLFKQKPIIILSLLWVLTAACNAGIYSVLPLYLIKERGITYALANNLVGASRISGIIVQVSIGFCADRYSYKKILWAILLFTGLSTAFLAIAPTFSLLLAALFLQAFFSISFFPVGLAAIAKLTPLPHRSISTGAVISIGAIFGMGLAPFLIGFVADYFSFQIGILVLGILTALSSLSLNYLKEI